MGLYIRQAVALSSDEKQIISQCPDNPNSATNKLFCSHMSGVYGIHVAPGANRPSPSLCRHF